MRHGISKIQNPDPLCLHLDQGLTNEAIGETTNETTGGMIAEMIADTTTRMTEDLVMIDAQTIGRSVDMSAQSLHSH